VVASVAMVHPAPQVDPVAVLKARRAAIDEVASAIEHLGPGADPEVVAAVVGQALSTPELEFLVSLEGGSERLVSQSVEEYMRFTRSIASNAISGAGLVRILLLQNIDLAWWDHEIDLETDRDVREAPDLLDLRKERRAGRVDFGFGVASDGLVHRTRDFIIQRAFPGREPRGPGLPFVAIRPAMLGLLNELAAVTATFAPEGTPPIWVNSISRSVEHQHRLKALGFSALHPSAHCRGWAADIEVGWFARFGADDVLRDVLMDYLERGILNVIDEGRAWHVCLSPDHVAHFADRQSGR